MHEERHANDHMCCVVLCAHTHRCSVAVFAVTALTAGRSYAASVGGFSLPAIVTSLFKNLWDLLHPKGFVSEWLNRWQGLASLLCLLQHRLNGRFAESCMQAYTTAARHIHHAEAMPR